MKKGLTKDYLRYAQEGCFNLIASHESNLLYHPKLDGKVCITSACENVFYWDLKKGQKIMTIEGDKYLVTRVAVNKKHLAVGYSDGTIKLFDTLTGELAVTFSGHKSAVTALNFDSGGMRLVSGAKDTDLIIWDIVNECGLYRLHGHKGAITQAQFLNKYNVLVSSSTDTLVKFWDLDVQHCFHTVVHHRSEVYDFVVCHDETHIVTGSGDMDLNVFRLSATSEEALEEEQRRLQQLWLSGRTDNGRDEEDESTGVLRCRLLGKIQRQGRGRVMNMRVDNSNAVIGCHGKDNTLELFEIVTMLELGQMLQRQIKKAKKRARETETPREELRLEAEDMFRPLTNITMSSKLRGFDVVGEHNTIKIVGLLHNNSLEQWSASVKSSDAPSLINKILHPAHRTDVRSLCFTNDNTALASGSGESIKVWNRASAYCIRTLPSDYVLGLVFAPGDRHLVASTKTGRLVIADVSGGQVLEVIDAHGGEVTGLCMAPSKKSVVTGSSDKTVKFWDFELAAGETAGKHLTLIHTKTLDIGEQVLSLAMGSNGKHLAVALLDFTVKVFFADTLKFCLSLYGHKLPVLCIDISTDCSLIASGSADKNVKIWGLDFGDCHKSLFAHDDSVMGLKFVPNAHTFFTVGKDGMVKHWDADNFELIQTLKGHHFQIWDLAISPNGRHIATAGHDHSIRVWGETEEILVLEEEQEMEREEKEQEQEAQQGITGAVAGEGQTEVGPAAKKTCESVRGAEKIIEALEFYREEPMKDPTEAMNPLFTAYKVDNALDYLGQVIRRLRSSEVEPALILLPYSEVQTLLVALNEFLVKHFEIELTCRCIFFLLRIHQGQITSSQLQVVDDLRYNTRNAVTFIRNPTGFNLAGLTMLKCKIEEAEEFTMFQDASDRFQEQKKKEKQRTILAITT